SDGRLTRKSEVMSLANSATSRLNACTPRPLIDSAPSGGRTSWLALPPRSSMPAPSSGDERSKPLRDGFLKMNQLPALEDGHLTVRDVQVAVVVNQDVRQLQDCCMEIVERSRKPRPEFVVGNVVTALRNAHGHPLCRLSRAGQADVAQHDDVAGLGGFCQ